jgi:hypothetical protein
MPPKKSANIKKKSGGDPGFPVNSNAVTYPQLVQPGQYSLGPADHLAGGGKKKKKASSKKK